MVFELYVITDRAVGRGRSHGEIARCALAGGADVIQLRDKGLATPELLAVAREIRDLARETGALFIVNDRIDVAISSGADGVHLGQGDLPVREAGRIAPPDFIIGVSVGCIAEAIAAENAGAGYVAVSPTFPTSSKDDAGPGHGIEVLRGISSSVSVPVIAIGGITARNVPEVIDAGASGIAVISAVVGQDDITKAAREMKAIVTSAKARRRPFFQ